MRLILALSLILAASVGCRDSGGSSGSGPGGGGAGGGGGGGGGDEEDGLHDQVSVGWWFGSGVSGDGSGGSRPGELGAQVLQIGGL